MRRGARRRPLRAPAALLFLALMAILYAPPQSAADVPQGQEFFNPAGWAPQHVYTIMSNGQPQDVAYWFRWEYPMTWFVHEPERHVLELGWKQTEKDGCHGTAGGSLGSNFTEAGFPQGVYKAVDYAEDLDDAVVWVKNMDVVALAQFSDPNREFYMSWDCAGTQVFNANIINEATFNVQMNVAAPSPAHPRRHFTARLA